MFQSLTSFVIPSEVLSYSPPSSYAGRHGHDLCDHGPHYLQHHEHAHDRVHHHRREDGGGDARGLPADSQRLLHTK